MSAKAILRRQCKRAMRQLILRFGYKEADFEIPETSDNDMDVLPGTPIYWYTSSYECAESDCKTALDEYRHLIAESSVDWSAAHMREYFKLRYEAMRKNPEWFWVGSEIKNKEFY